MQAMNLKFLWDPDKEKLNRAKHKISFAQACFVFTDKFALTLYDCKHSQNEERWITLGMTNNNLILVVAHTYRTSLGIEYVRIISARKATKNETKQYHKRRL